MMILIVVWILAVVLSLALFFVFLSNFKINPQILSISSLSWAGYTIENNSSPQFAVTAINASWTIPQVNASAGDGYSSAWIGIGGQLDKSLIQVGTEHDTVNGRATYVVWYELLPTFAVKLNDLPISPGDVMMASINQINPDTNEWNLQISDATTGQAFSKTVTYNSTRSSGEWIIERPTISSQISSLADFGNVTFNGCYLTLNSNVGSIDKFSYSKINIVNNVNGELASTSTLSADGTSFTVYYLASK